MKSLSDKIISSREQRFVALAKDEATCDGYRKYAPLCWGAWKNGLSILLIALVVPLYLTWLFIRKFFSVKEVNG